VRAGDLRRRRAAAQLLHRPAGSSDPAASSVPAGPRHSAGTGPEHLVGRLLAVQAQDLRSARLALRARSAGLAAADVDRALTVDRSLVMAWLCRGTLHLVRSEDYPWLFGLTAPDADRAGNRRRLTQEGVSTAQAEAAVGVIERALAAEGPLTRMELGRRLDARGLPTAGQALPHLLFLAARRGLVVLAPVGPGGQAFALTRDWLGSTPERLTGTARESALARLTRRYLAGHGPASAGDLAGWSGLPVGETRAGLDAVGAEVAVVEDDLVDLAGREPAPSRVPARLLPAFDPYLLGWRDRSFAVPAAHAGRVYPGGGMLRATAVADGLAVGTWTARRGRGRPRIGIEPFAPLPARAEEELRFEADDVARFLAAGD